MPAPRRFPKPWTVIENHESFEVQDATGFPLAYLYFEDDFKRNWAVIKGRLTKDEARRIAYAIARLPELLMLEKQMKAGGNFD
jgi:hypothetical protein